MLIWKFIRKQIRVPTDLKTGMAFHFQADLHRYRSCPVALWALLIQMTQKGIYMFKTPVKLSKYGTENTVQHIV